jgi:hypothetical protein
MKARPSFFVRLSDFTRMMAYWLNNRQSSSTSISSSALIAKEIQVLRSDST